MQAAHNNMIQNQIRTWEVRDERLLAALETVPRENFVPSAYEGLAYADCRIPLANEQVMLPPKEQARILQALNVQSTETVFEIGTSTGYLTALLGMLAKQVYSTDVFSDFTQHIKQQLDLLQLNNVQLFNDNIWQNWNKYAAYGPFDVIVCEQACYELPRFLLENLTSNGRLFAIIGQGSAMSAVLVERTPSGWRETSLFETVAAYAPNIPQPTIFKF